MKSPLLKTTMVAVATLFFFACSTGNKNENNETADQTAAEAEDTPAEEATGQSGQMLLVWHEVEDYDRWRPVYDSNLPNILDGGMTRVVVGREHGNENHVMVGHTVHDIDAARAFVDSDDLKAKMESGGVTGEPEMAFVDVISYGGSHPDNLERVMLRYKITDWDTYKPIFDEAVGGKGEPGLKFLFMSRDTDDANMITIVNVVKDQAKAKSYLESDELKGKMEAATIEGDVEVRYFTAEYIDDGNS